MKTKYRRSLRQWYWDSVMKLRYRFRLKQPKNSFFGLANQRGVKGYKTFGSKSFKGWRLGNPWSINKTHVNNPHIWYDWSPEVTGSGQTASCVYEEKAMPTTADKDNVALFKIEEFTAMENVGSTFKFREGLYRLVFSSDAYDFGWNALWLFGYNEDEGLSIEIDLIEDYGKAKDGGVAESNLHFGLYNKGIHNQSGAVKMYVQKSGTNEIILDWHKDSIRIFIDGTLVRKIVDEKVLKLFRNQEMELKATASCMASAAFGSSESVVESRLFLNSVSYYEYD